MLASASAVRHLARSASRHTSRLGGVRCMGGIEAYDDYGKACFTGAVADEYLQKQGASGDLLKDPSWTKTHSDVVAAAVLDWCVYIDFSPVALHGTRLVFMGMDRAYLEMLSQNMLLEELIRFDEAFALYAHPTAFYAP